MKSLPMPKISLPPFGSQPTIVLLDIIDEDGEPLAAVVRPGKMPEIYSSLARAVHALRRDLA